LPIALTSTGTVFCITEATVTGMDSLADSVLTFARLPEHEEDTRIAENSHIRVLARLGLVTETDEYAG